MSAYNFFHNGSGTSTFLTNADTLLFYTGHFAQD